jgi:DNA-binding HxlR family transcriptional regulator
MYDYDEACPISMAAAVLCERWTVQIVRELFFGSTHYSEIQKYIPNISPTMLRNRLRYLEDQGVIIRKRPAGTNRYEYFLTPSGKALAPVLTEMGKWGMCHASSGMTSKQNTAWGLVRDLAGALDVEQLPDGDTSIRIELTDVEEKPVHYIHVRDGKVEVCDTDLGLETDVFIRSTLDVMTRVWYGETDLLAAIESGSVTVAAAPIYTRRIRHWLRISSFTTDTPSVGGS